jgi:hypothetical protein
MNEIEKKHCAMEMIRLSKYTSISMTDIFKFIEDAGLLNNKNLRKLKLEKIMEKNNTGATKSKVNIQDGEYNALWSAYVLDILDVNRNIIATTKTYVGVRGINCPTKVKVEYGVVTFISQK